MKKKLLRVVGATGMILVIPFVAMQYTVEVNWDETDFIVAGVLIFVTGLVFEYVALQRKTRLARVLSAIAVMLVFVLVWAELAVGLFGTRWAGS